jgi:hypothetical protein
MTVFVRTALAMGWVMAGCGAARSGQHLSGRTPSDASFDAPPCEKCNAWGELVCDDDGNADAGTWSAGEAP